MLAPLQFSIKSTSDPPFTTGEVSLLHTCTGNCLKFAICNL